jgi:ABC-2 type transport system permease protein
MKYIKLWYYFFKENLYYWDSILARSIFLILLCIIVYTLIGMWVNFNPDAIVWWVKYENYIWYIWIWELVVMGALKKSFFNEILSWEVINYLIRPISFLYLFWWKILGSKLVMTFILGIFSFPIILILNNFNFPSFNLIIFIFIFFLWLSISVFIDTIIFLFAFWLENIVFLRLIFQKIYFIFWWLFFPLSIYPAFLQQIANLLPFQYALQMPAKYFTTWNINFLFENNGFYVVFVWFLILIIINFFLYSHMIRKLELNGG